MEYIDLILKIIILFFLAATSELAFKKRKWGLMILSFAVWITFFRTAILRAISLYTGAFNNASETTLNFVINFFMQGIGLVISDILVLVGSLLAFLIISENKKI